MRNANGYLIICKKSEKNVNKRFTFLVMYATMLVEGKTASKLNRRKTMVMRAGLPAPPLTMW